MYKKLKDKKLLLNLGRNIEALRIHHKISQSALAAQIGTHRVSYSRAIRGEHQFSISQFAQICRIFQVNAGKLLFKELKGEQGEI